MKKLSSLVLLLCFSLAGCSLSTESPLPSVTEASSVTDGDELLPAWSEGSSITEADVRLAADLIARAAGDLSYMTQVSLSAVLLNRIAYPTFPDTLKEVASELAIPECTYTDSQYNTAKKAFLEALEGNDPTGGALYFSRAGSSGAHYIIPSFECGGMVFGQ